MKAISIIPGEPAKVIEFRDTLQNLQEYVQGNIEVNCFPGTFDVVMITNDICKLNGMKYNFCLPSNDYVAGPCLIVGVCEDYFVGLTDDQILAVESRIEAVRSLKCWEEL